jgi:MoaA/NifB/PqqE/SkfB family radical SAM enzyme
MDERTRKAYELEYSRGAVNVTSKCNRACFYCSQFWNPAELMPDFADYLPFEVIKKNLKLIPDKHIKCIGAGQTRVNMGEFFLHPQSKDILEYIKNESFTLGSMSTNGALITEEEIKIIKEIGFESAEKAPRGESRGVGLHLTAYNNKIRRVFDMLDDYEIPYQIIIIAGRYEIDLGRIEKWIKSCQRHKNPTEITIEMMSYTKHAPKDVIDKMEISRAELQSHVEKWRKLFPKHEIEHYTGNLNSVYILLAIDWFYHTFWRTAKFQRGQSPSTLFLNSESVEDTFEATIEIFADERQHDFDNYKTVTVKNQTFGGNIECSGLLLAADFLSALEEIVTEDYNPDYIVIPGNSFPYDDTDLEGVHASVISDKYVNSELVWC